MSELQEENFQAVLREARGTSLGHLLLPIAERDPELRETLRSRVARFLDRLRPEKVEEADFDPPITPPPLPTGELCFRTLTLGNASVEVRVETPATWTVGRVSPTYAGFRSRDADEGVRNGLRESGVPAFSIA